MKRLQIPLLLLFAIFSFFHLAALSQTLAVDSSSTPAFRNAVAFYNNSFSRQFHLFNGKEYADYSRPFDKGQPYFLTQEWRKGTIKYEGTTYDEVTFLYNVVTDRVIILNHDGVSKIELLKENVSEFSFPGRSFINLPKDSLPEGMREGFYNVLAKGKVILLARHTKTIKTFTRQKVDYEISEKVYYYLKKNGSYLPVTRRKAFLSEFGDHKKAIQQFIKQNRLNYRKDQENTMVKAVEYYNMITR